MNGLQATEFVVGETSVLVVAYFAFLVWLRALIDREAAAKTRRLE